MNILDIYKGLVPFLGEAWGKTVKSCCMILESLVILLLLLPMEISVAVMWAHRRRILF